MTDIPLTTARLRFCSYIPSGWIAITFTNLEFFGKNAKALNERWHDIEFEKYRVAEMAITRQREAWNVLESAFIKERQRSGWCPFSSRMHRELRRQQRATTATIDQFKEDRFYSASELLFKAHSFLSELGAILVNETTDAHPCETRSEVYNIPA